MKAYIIAPTAQIAEMVARGRPEIKRRSDFRYVSDESQVWGHTAKDSGVEFLAYEGSRGHWISSRQLDALAYLRGKGIPTITVIESELRP